jgi:hypothetical protein
MHSIGLYTGQGADHNLHELPGRILRADIQWDQSFFTGISYQQRVNQFADIFPVLDNTAIGSMQQGYEVVLLKHHGLQDNLELGAAYTLRTADAKWGPVGMNAGFGIGLSHAFGEPSYEDGPFNNPDRHYRTQLLLLFDAGMRLNAYPAWSLVARVHHRSGAYGVIAPRNVGSNFLAVGLMYGF